jgi:hypothetical protein
MIMQFSKKSPNAGQTATKEHQITKSTPGAQETLAFLP